MYYVCFSFETLVDIVAITYITSVDQAVILIIFIAISLHLKLQIV